MADRTVQLRRGRLGGLNAFGDPVAQRVVVLCHPAPGAARFDPDPAVTSRWGVHLVALDRPGYGVSTPLPDDERPSIAAYADDIGRYLGTIADESRSSGQPVTTKVGVVGWSAGGRVALALAARYPGIVDRVAVVATPAPDSAVRWIAPDHARTLTELATLPAPEAKRRLRDVLAGQAADPGDLSLLGAGTVDEATLERPGLRDRLDRMLREAYRQGATGVADDLLSYATDDWGFSLGDVQAPVLLVYGGSDAHVPSAHGRWYRRHLHHAHLTVKPRTGHLVLVDAWEDVLAHVDPGHGRTVAADPRR